MSSATPDISQDAEPTDRAAVHVALLRAALELAVEELTATQKQKPLLAQTGNGFLSPQKEVCNE